MKIEKIRFENHKILKNLEMNFCDKDEQVLNTIVVIGENGSGKTTLLKSIYDSFSVDECRYKEVEKNRVETTLSGYTTTVRLEEGESIQPNGILNFEKKMGTSKIVYMPTEINFEKINKVDNTFDFSPNFQNTVDQNITQNIPSLIATKINKEIFRNRNKTIGEVIDKVCDDINSIFEIMNLDVKLIGLSEDNDTKPLFKNEIGNEFDITGLSSGEKQLFLRGLALKFLGVNNSIILIDEPEISLHPEWQQKIIHV
ncbi:MAG: AAA family ATPase, partial [Clostridium sp.]|uniref:AAA family ATPase n=1 Tax=Clostridium sp. TaxID=1506 RepID=UPI003F3B447E